LAFRVRRRKKIGKFITAEKVPYHLRKKILIVSDSEKIIWVWPVRITEKAKVAADTRRIVQLKIITEGQTAN